MPRLTVQVHGGRGGGGVRLAGGLGPGRRDDLLGKGGLHGPSHLVPLLPLGVVVVQGGRQHGIGKQPAVVKKMGVIKARRPSSLTQNCSIYYT